METIKRQNGAIVGVIDRAPFTRGGEVIVKAGEKNVTFPDNASTHNMDRDFEVPFLTFKLTALAEGAVCDPQPDVLDRLIKIRATDQSRNHPLGNALPLIAVGDGVYRWTPQKPFTLVRGDTWGIHVEGRESFDIAFDGKRRRIDQIRVEVTFEGELLTYATNWQQPAPTKDAGVESPLG